MDAEKIQFPKEFLQEAGKRNIMGCRGAEAEAIDEKIFE